MILYSVDILALILIADDDVDGNWWYGEFILNSRYGNFMLYDKMVASIVIVDKDFWPYCLYCWSS